MTDIVTVRSTSTADGSWLNFVERWFADLTAKQLRRGVRRSVAQLKAAIREYIAAHHAHPKPFIWTTTADQILASIARVAQRSRRHFLRERSERTLAGEVASGERAARTGLQVALERDGGRLR